MDPFACEKKPLVCIGVVRRFRPGGLHDDVALAAFMESMG